MTKEERQAYQKAYYAAHKKRIKTCQRVYYAAHKNEVKARQKVWRETHKENRRIYRELHHCRKKYGITLADRQRLIDGQNGLCKICQKSLGKGSQVCIDHNHNTGEIRGILCRQCNTMLGLAGDNPEILFSGYQYLT